MGSAGKEMIERHGKGEVKGMIWDKKIVVIKEKEREKVLG